MRTSEDDNGPEGSPSGPLEDLNPSGIDNGPGRLRTPEAEMAGFEPAVRFDPHAALAKRCADAATNDSANTSGTGTPALTLPLHTAATADPDMTRIVVAWPELPAPIRLAVLALIGSAAGS